MSPSIVRAKASFGLRYVICFTLLLSALISCEKQEGTGGTGSISGTILECYYNTDYSDLILKQPAVDEEVFMLYGEDNVLGDRVFTGINGDFRFDYLYPGRYYIYYKSADSTSFMEGEKEKIYLIDLERGEKKELGDLEKLTVLDYDEGGALIKGVVKVIDYVDESSWPNLVIDHIDFAQEQEIYLTYNHHAFYDDRIRTQYDGYFEFSHLIPGDYMIFLYSEDVTRATERVVLKFEVTISEFDQVVDLGEITIEKL